MERCCSCLASTTYYCADAIKTFKLVLNDRIFAIIISHEFAEASHMTHTIRQGPSILFFKTNAHKDEYFMTLWTNQYWQWESIVETAYWRLNWAIFQGWIRLDGCRFKRAFASFLIENAFQWSYYIILNFIAVFNSWVTHWRTKKGYCAPSNAEKVYTKSKRPS